MHVTSHSRPVDGVIERRFTLDDVPGILWTPDDPPSQVPVILLGHPGGLPQMYPRLLARARRAVSDGFAAATLELPGAGDRPRIPALDDARSEMHSAIRSGEQVSDDVVDRLVVPLVDQAVPELQALMDAILDLAEIGGPVGYSGGVVSIGVRLAVVDPRIVAAGLFAGSFVPRAILEQVRQVTVPVHVLLQWDDEGNDHRMALDLFDALGSTEKTLNANLGGHRGVPAYAGDDAARFFTRHLR